MYQLSLDPKIEVPYLFVEKHEAGWGSDRAVEL